jgi:hypothetical protein
MCTGTEPSSPRITLRTVRFHSCARNPRESTVATCVEAGRTAPARSAQPQPRDSCTH